MPSKLPGDPDLALYRELASGNIDYDSKAKTYVLGADFARRSITQQKELCRG